MNLTVLNKKIHTEGGKKNVKDFKNYGTLRAFVER